MKNLVNETRWVAWRYIKHADGKMAKVPFCPDAEKQEGIATRSHWHTFDDLKAILKNYRGSHDGIGFYLTKSESSDLRLCFLDIDAHHTEDGQENPLSAEILNLFAGTYCEKSPSGNGYHIYFYADVDKLGGDVVIKDSYKTGDDTELELYIGVTGETAKRYSTFTMNMVSETDEITDQTEAMRIALERYFKKDEKPVKKRNPHASSSTVKITNDPKNYVANHDFDIAERLEMARRSCFGNSEKFIRLYDKGEVLKADKGMSEATLSLLRILCRCFEGDVKLIDTAFRGSKLMREKWDERRRNTTWGGMLIKKALDSYAQEAPRIEPEFWPKSVLQPRSSDSNPGTDTAEAMEFHASAEDVLDLINDYAEEKNTEKITVLPFMCGTGKSTAIRLYMKQIIDRVIDGGGFGDGAIIITDNIERMLDYLRPHDDELYEFFQDYWNKIMVFTHDTPKEIWERQAECPILIMTTQRFTRLEHRKIKEYSKWEGGNRSVTLVDETPNFKQTFEWNDVDLDRIRSAIENKIPDESDRKALLEEWESFTDRNKMAQYNDCLPGLIQGGSRDRYLILTVPHKAEKYRYSKMIELFQKYRCTLNSMQSMDNFHDFAFEAEAMVESVTGIGIFEHLVTPKGVKVNKCYTLIDNISRYTCAGTKVIVLDGTALYSVQYQLYDCVEIVDCRQYNRDLSRMTIHLIDAPTGKTALKNDSVDKKNRIVAAIMEFISGLPMDKVKNSALFTYKFLEKDFVCEQRDNTGDSFTGFNENYTEYFGNIRGKNSFRNCLAIFQVGFNRWEDVGYQLYDLAHRYFDREDHLPLIDEVVHLSPFVRECIWREQLAELEQNIFRGTIRNAYETDEYHYYLFMPFLRNRDLLDAIERRFHSELGANIVYEQPIASRTFADYMAQYGNDSGEKTSAAKVIAYHESLPLGTAYTMNDIKAATGLTTRQLNKVKENRSIRDAFASEEDGRIARPKVYIAGGSWRDLEYFA